MTLRVSQGVIKSGITSTSNVQVSQGVIKSSVTASSNPVVSAGIIKAAVRTYPIRRIVKVIPPVPLTVICSCNPVCCFTYG